MKKSDYFEYFLYVLLYNLFLLLENCQPCNITKSKKRKSRPNEENFRKHVQSFLTDIPDVECAKAGRAAYLDVSNHFFLFENTNLNKI